MPSFTLESRLDGAVGGKTASALDRAFGMRTVGDFLSHYPRRYAKRGELTPISSLPVGEPVTIVAEVRRASERRMQNRRGSILEVVISEMDVRVCTSDLATQGTRYHDVVAACLEQPACTAVTVWGVTDKYSWLNSREDICGAAALPLLFDGNYVPKPAYDGFLNALMGE